ncbi:reductive dehalogenase domain-containing protein [Clostridium oceanicum]|uniref:4Fe-4S ferredoxin-type domain-containing protein n=1 Tax=Clostridium oceanicum TaxID=1543 RepID=A0ABP3UWU9_9CLOT
MSIKKIMPNINKHIDKSKPYINPSEHAHEGLNVPEIVLKYGSMKTKAKSLPNLYKYMFGSIKEMNKTYKELYKQPKNPLYKITAKDMEDMKALAKEYGVNDIGFTKVDSSYIFSDKKILYPNAIVILMEMKHDIINTAPSKKAEKEIFRTYYELNVAVNRIKDFLNSRGYNAEAGPSLGGEVNYPLLAQKAGIGVIGKHGMLITPKFGPSLRLAAVYTDIENLPFSEENPHMWVNAFCDNCNRCVNKCPAKAIYKYPKIFEDGSKRCIDYKKCAVPFSKNRGCTVCVKECMFFKNDYNKIKKSFLKE